MNVSAMLDSKVKIIALIVAIISTAFSVFTWFASESKLAVKDNHIQKMAMELFTNNKQINSLQDSITSLELDYNKLLLKKDSIKLQSDSIRLISHSYSNQINDLYAKIDSLSLMPVNAPDSAQLRIFLQWTSK